MARTDSDLTTVLVADGIERIDAFGSINQAVCRLDELKARMGDPPWSVRIVYTDTMSGVIISQNPGQGNRWHYHPDSDEWWVMLEGEMEWNIEGMDSLIAKKGDVVFVPRRTKHMMRAMGTGPSTRLSIGIPDVPHVYVEQDS